MHSVDTLLKFTQASLELSVKWWLEEKKELSKDLSIGSPRRFMLVYKHIHLISRHMRHLSGRGSACHYMNGHNYKVVRVTRDKIIPLSKKRNLIKAVYVSWKSKCNAYLRCRSIYKIRNWERHGSKSSSKLLRRIKRTLISQLPQNTEIKGTFFTQR